MRMLRRATGLTRRNRIKNDNGYVKQDNTGNKVGYVVHVSRDEDYVGKRVMNLEIRGKMKRRRPKPR